MDQARVLGPRDGAEQSAVAPVPAEVPQLADNIRSTPDMQLLKKSLLADSGAQTLSVASQAASAGAKVGAFGMGGIGKTSAPEVLVARSLVIGLLCKR